MSDLGFLGLERALAACLFCAKGMASRDPKAARTLHVVIAMIETARRELAHPEAPHAYA